MKKAVVLLSGGLDSAVALHEAIRAYREVRCLTFDYGQRHRKELDAARRVARSAGVHQLTMRIQLPWKGSSLTDTKRRLPLGRTLAEIRTGVPSTYVPARNSVFLSLGASYAEAIGAEAVYIGAHAEDASGYPDCRRPFLEAFGRAIAVGTAAGGRGKLKIVYPLIGLDKAGIIRRGMKLGVPFEHTWSCYAGGRRPCKRCDSCILRAKGFQDAGFRDPLAGERYGA